MKAVVVVEPGKLEVVDIKEPTVGPYQAKVKTLIGTPCNATDGKLIAGHFPGMEDYPLVLGHESAGVVEEIGDKVRNFRVGDTAIGGLVFDFAEKELKEKKLSKFPEKSKADEMTLAQTADIVCDLTGLLETISKVGCEACAARIIIKSLISKYKKETHNG